jgi:hypothetical protein
MGGATQLMHTWIPAPGTVRVVNAMTVDVEDYFQVSAFEAHVDKDQWQTWPLRVEQNTLRILELFAAGNIFYAGMGG